MWTWLWLHYIDVIRPRWRLKSPASRLFTQIVYSDADQRKHQSSASLAFVWGIHRDRWIPRTKGQLRGKCFHLVTSSCHGLTGNVYNLPQATIHEPEVGFTKPISSVPLFSQFSALSKHTLDIKYHIYISSGRRLATHWFLCHSWVHLLMDLWDASEDSIRFKKDEMFLSQLLKIKTFPSLLMKLPHYDGTFIYMCILPPISLTVYIYWDHHVCMYLHSFLVMD